jgi:hypothetical protein
MLPRIERKDLTGQYFTRMRRACRHGKSPRSSERATSERWRFDLNFLQPVLPPIRAMSVADRIGCAAQFLDTRYRSLDYAGELFGLFISSAIA